MNVNLLFKTSFFLTLLSVLFFTSCSKKENKKIDIEYQKKLNATKKYYPFESWLEAFNNGLDQYTPANCSKASDIFDELISGLVEIGKNAPEKEKVELFKKAVLALNDLNMRTGHRLIETGEAEQLWELINQISIASGIDPTKYGGGEGLASKWRDW